MLKTSDQLLKAISWNSRNKPSHRAKTT